ncbi:hypothetical protein CEUSTIGMA_g434.t1 [Chlamydomonas eustigma]|uniref:TOG domain-containing protein n=1 Tax=Chlamydomonas eustigma TaxID=1157962 RepID=A0A250WQP1_9CHLO|nr:hypothetical protein CEUSTIGMA_g434.t1 [Chlamydomonas eustigma]|eukprot:GAX72982.1 hypothetical protein CEUSTIGMA_g434.t1 [Chlamydomonas eustigma]
MATSKKSIDDIWRELNSKPTGRRGTLGTVMGGATNMPGISTSTKTVPSVPAHNTTPNSASMLLQPDTDISMAEARRSSNYDPALAGVSAESMNAYIATIQRTINCLSDPDRSTRKQAITSLLLRLIPDQENAPKKEDPTSIPDPNMLQALICGPLLHPVTNMLHDTGEGSRVASVQLMRGCAAVAPDFSPTLPALVPEILRRMGHLPVVEPAEEVRLLLAELVSTIITRSSTETLKSYAGDLCTFLLRALEDGFHDIKKVACACITSLTRKVPAVALEAHAEKLLQALLPNLQHQHSRVRLVVIEALGSLLGCGCVPGGLVQTLVCPALRPVAYDRAPAVREALFAAVASWLGHRASDVEASGQKDQEDCTSPSSSPLVFTSPDTAASLLPLLLTGVSDPQADVGTQTLQLVEGVGRWWVDRGDRGGDAAVSAFPSQDQQMTDAEQGSTEASSKAEQGVGNSGAVDERVAEAAVAACQLGPPYTCRPGAGARAMVKSLLPLLIKPLLSEVGEWTVSQRSCASRQLHSVLVFAEHHVETELPRLLPSLCSAIGDEDMEVAGRIMACVHVVGAHVEPRRWLPLMLDNVSNARLSLVQKANTLVVLSGLLNASSKVSESLLQDHEMVAAARASTPTSVLTSLTSVLCSDEMRASEHPAIRNQLLAVSTNMIRWLGNRAAEVVQQLYTLLLQLYGFEKEPSRLSTIQVAMLQLASASGRSSFDDLAQEFGPAVLEAACSGADQWSTDVPSYLVFRALLLTCGGTTLSQMVTRLCDVLKPLMEDHESEPELRINALQLLDSVLEDQHRGISLGGEAASLVLSHILLPPLVWRAGKSSAAVRFAAITAFATMLRRSLAPSHVLLNLVASGAVLPPIIQSMDEDWYTDLRNTACFVMRELLLAVGKDFSAEARRTVYPELIKRLDDSNNQVRKAACRALHAFCTSMPSSYCDTNTAYLIQGVVIHMDDSNQDVQEAACSVLEALALVKPTVVATEVSKVRDRFRSQHFCDRVLSSCK